MHRARLAAFVTVVLGTSQAHADYPCGIGMTLCSDGTCRINQYCSIGGPEADCGPGWCCTYWEVDLSGSFGCALGACVAPTQFDPCPAFQACEAPEPRDPQWTNVNLWTQCAIHSAYAFTMVVNDHLRVPIEYVCDDSESESHTGELGRCWKSTLDETITPDGENLVLATAAGKRTYYRIAFTGTGPELWNGESPTSADDGTTILRVNDRYYLVNEREERLPRRVYTKIGDRHRLTRIEYALRPYEGYDKLPDPPTAAQALSVTIERHANGRLKAIHSPRGPGLGVTFVYQDDDPTKYLKEVRGPRYDPARPNVSVWRFHVDPSTQHFFAMTAPSADGTKSLVQWFHYGAHHLIDRIQNPDRTQTTYRRKNDSGRIVNVVLRHVPATTSMPTTEAAAPAEVGEAKAEATIGQCGGGGERHTTITLPFGRSQETVLAAGKEARRHLLKRTVDQHGIAIDRTYDDRDRLDRESFQAGDGHTYWLKHVWNPAPGHTDELNQILRGRDDGPGKKVFEAFAWRVGLPTRYTESDDGIVVTLTYDDLLRVTEVARPSRRVNVTYHDDAERTVIGVSVNGEPQGYWSINRFSDLVEMRDQRQAAAHGIEVTDGGKFLAYRDAEGDELRATAWNPHEVATELRRDDGSQARMALNASDQLLEQSDDVFTVETDYDDLGIAYGSTTSTTGGGIRLRQEEIRDERDITRVDEVRYGREDSMTVVQDYTSADLCEGWGPEKLCINEDVIQCI